MYLIRNLSVNAKVKIYLKISKVHYFFLFKATTKTKPVPIGKTLKYGVSQSRRKKYLHVQKKLFLCYVLGKMKLRVQKLISPFVTPPI